MMHCVLSLGKSFLCLELVHLRKTGNRPDMTARERERLSPVLKALFSSMCHNYACSQSISDGSILEPSELDWLQVYYMTH